MNKEMYEMKTGTAKINGPDVANPPGKPLKEAGLLRK
jgi:hypothetical protein